MTENPANPPLTRKQLREIRNTGATPVVSQEAIESARQDAADAAASTETAHEKVEVAAAPLARAAEPAVIGARPVADSAVDLGVSPLTRRQARQQERIRTASVPVITPDLLEATPRPATTSEAERGEQAASEPASHDDGSAPTPDADTAAAERATVSPKLGAELLEAEAVQVDLPPSFDQLLTRAPASTSSTPHALIVSQTPSPQIMAPVNATGEVIITGMLNLPDGLGSTGHAPGTADGKDVDAVLVDGELPAHSSPTPIAASAAISTVKLPGEIIQPPAPEKGSRLMIALAITAGALALALAAVLILAFVSGVFA
ncbi:hypothetical protein HDC37_001905 [Microbacterium sp. AK009]|uniref:hypothetical protein n=1 Tax=Microbacterium sp. AK009 TaxID=2723068 RepID=UPI0015CDB76A|nr:hypothetical protein [Microbacterium sp. AK009]NYF17077.1 hypothetical protein [Microbacterium sp. AK009]